MPSPVSILSRNNVRIVGEGDRSIMLAHGFGCDQSMWRFLIPLLEKEFRLILFDYVGSGGSDVGAYNEVRYNSLEGYASDVLEVCGALELRNTIFVGHSVSGMIGLLASIREPDRFNHLVMVAPSPRYLNDPPAYVGGFEREDLEGLLELMEKNPLGWPGFLAPLVMGRPHHADLTSELEASFCALEPDIARQFARVTFMSDMREHLSKVNVSALILQCREDAIAPPSVGSYLSTHMPQSTLHTLDTRGHCPHMSAPYETAEAIRSYLNAAPA